MKKYGMVWILCLFFILFCPQSVYAEEFVSTKNGLDVMFVMDYSGSMKTNDSQDIARGMVKAFVDTVHSADIRVGFVAYNDRILTSTSPLTIQTEEERAKLKELRLRIAGEAFRKKAGDRPDFGRRGRFKGI